MSTLLTPKRERSFKATAFPWVIGHKENFRKDRVYIDLASLRDIKADKKRRMLKDRQ